MISTRSDRITLQLNSQSDDHGMIIHNHYNCVFRHSLFFFSFLNGTLDVVVAGEAGGVLEVETVDGDAMLVSAGAGLLFSTTADMVWSLTGQVDSQG